MDESQQRETPAWSRNLNSVLPAFLPYALTEFRSQLLDTTRYPPTHNEAAQSIERELKTLQHGIVSMPTEDWRSLSEKLQDRMEAEKLPIVDESGEIIEPNKINDEIFRIGMTHLGKMNEVVATPLMKSEYLLALSREQERNSSELGRSGSTGRTFVPAVQEAEPINRQRRRIRRLHPAMDPMVNEFGQMNRGTSVRLPLGSNQRVLRLTRELQETQRARFPAASELASILQTLSHDQQSRLSRLIAVADAVSNSAMSARNALASALPYLSEDQRSRLTTAEAGSVLNSALAPDIGSAAPYMQRLEHLSPQETETDHASPHSSAQQAETTAASLRFIEDNARDSIATPTNQLASNLRPLPEDQRADQRAAIGRIRNRQNRGLDERSRDTRDTRDTRDNRGL
ncbi:hypothetical protein HFN63_32850 [Rhizobium leguminosarum]|uniref:hypothetical protein n=1 Tax=Rhizobium leguminosarum TaxID=384 RepID=UPI001C957DDB|nr:hypothetical protein [Rhizobium leguminosarum]MBY5774822.1 hypothetical protein [Rhizobium leguminosarum]